MAINNGQNYGSFVPTTNIWDTSHIQDIDVTSPEFKELLIRMYQNLNLMSLALNNKASGIYDTQEFVTGNLYPPNPVLSSATSTTPNPRNSYWEFVFCGALPNAATKSIPHNIPFNSGFTMIRYGGAASDTTGLTYLCLPYVDAAGTDNIQLDVDRFDVNITTESDRTNYNISYVILEYLKF
jgi:hypothetical protein